MESIGKKDIYGRTDLHLIAINGDMETLSSFTTLDFDLNAKDFYGETPLHLASRYGQLQVVDFLIDHGGDVNAKTKGGQSPLFRAESVEIARLLVDNGADVNLKNKNGQTPLHLAFRDKKLEIATFLVKRGSNINVKDKKGKTPLNLADENLCYEFKKPIIFFDGHCGLCSRWVDWLIRLDKNKKILIASLQGETAQKLLPEKDIQNPQTFVVYDRFQFFYKSMALFHLAKFIKGPMALILIFSWLSRRLTDWLYDLVANSRYRLERPKEMCRIPTEEEKEYFIP